MDIKRIDTQFSAAPLTNLKTPEKKTDAPVVQDTISIASDSSDKQPTRSEILSQAKPTAAEDPFVTDKKPFSDEDAKKAIQYFIDHGMENGKKAGFFKKILFIPFSIKDPDKVLDRIKKDKPVFLRNERNELSRVDSLDTLQVLDSLKGRGENTILKQDEFDALKFLEKGKDADDGIYNPKFWGETKLNSYDAYMAMRGGKSLEVNIGEQKDLQAGNLRNMAEANALYGEGNNTILPQNQFESLKYLEKGKDENDGLYASGEKINAYQALQITKEGGAVGINIDNRANLLASSPEDFAEANAFYGDGINTIMPAKDFKLFQYFENGKDDNDGFYVGENKANAYEALQKLQSGDGFSINIGQKSGLKVRNSGDLEEVDAFYGSGNNTILPQEHYDSMVYFDQGGDFRTPSGNPANAYEALQLMQSGKPAFIQNNDIRESVRTPEDILELDALEGRRINTILPQTQYDNLQRIKLYACDGPSDSKGKISAYGALQKFQDGEKVDYRMQGGDFSRSVYGKIDNIEGIPDALTKLANQQEYDKYKFSVPEYQEKSQKLNKKTPEILDKDINKSKGDIKQANGDIDDSNRKINDAEHRIRRAKSDLDDAESDLRHARYMDDYVTEYGYHYGHNPQTGKYEYYYGSHRVENEEKKRKIRQAESDIDEAERKLRRAKSDKESAERALDKAKKELQVAETRLAAGEDVGRILPELTSLINSVNNDNFSSLQRDLKDKLAQLSESAKPCGSELRNNLSDCGILMKVMDERPERPEGWVVPSPLLEEY